MIVHCDVAAAVGNNINLFVIDDDHEELWSEGDDNILCDYDEEE